VQQPGGEGFEQVRSVDERRWCGLPTSHGHGRFSQGRAVTVRGPDEALIPGESLYSIQTSVRHSMLQACRGKFTRKFRGGRLLTAALRRGFGVDFPVIRGPFPTSAVRSD
jgi:hypothetical protein